MNPRDFLALARRLVLATEEADWRTAISRAYYAAFLVACELMTDYGFTVPNADRAHAYLWLRLQNCGHLPTESAGVRLKDLRGWRNKSDYDIHRSVKQSDAQTAISRSESIIRVLDANRNEPIRSQITSAMQDYERNVLRDVTWHP